MNKVRFEGATLEDAITEATVQLGITSENLAYEVVEEATKGFLGIGAKNAAILAWDKNQTVEEEVKTPEKEESVSAESEATEEEKARFENAKEFLQDVFFKMGMEVQVTYNYTGDNTLEINLEGPEMGVLIGKRGQTLDSLQYLTSLVVNQKGGKFIRVKMDTENYRARRKEALETLAKNVAYKVKRTKKSYALEPMNPYERRIIHTVLQQDNFVMTKSEGEDPYRHVVIFFKRNRNGEER